MGERPDWSGFGQVTISGMAQPDVPVLRRGDYAAQQTNTVLWTPAAGRRFVLADILVSTQTEGTVTLLDGATVIKKFHLVAGGGAVENLQVHIPSAALNQSLLVTTSAAMVVFVAVGGYETI